ncbi:MAG: hypothetical protein IPK07_25765 [Deltaproteobacteria bacterium]|nr:hypothetical protein [Deltaproteobacteria bacterium]
MPRLVPRPRHARACACAAALLLAAACGGGSGAGDGGAVHDGLEPPLNPFLADSPWPMTHRNPYAQASSPYPGPRPEDVLAAQTGLTAPAPITAAVSSPYADGRRAIWGATFVSVFKAIERDGHLETVDAKQSLPGLGHLISGAYTVLDRDGTLFFPRVRTLFAYRDAEPGVPDSPIEQVGAKDLSDVLAESDEVVGMTLTYDGHIAFASAEGVVGVLTRDLSGLQTVRLGDAASPEQVSNSIATDEDGGLYVVTSRFMHRVQWTGTALTSDPSAGAWTSTYETGSADPATGRLGAGSGSTPTLMGTGSGDRFVVITDGQRLMHLTFLWRDAIPPDWQPIAPGKDRRIAAEIPVTFGDPSATASLSEQSVLVRGYDALVVNNLWNLPEPSPLGQLAVLLSGLPDVASYGVELFRWDPRTRTASSRWSNRDVSCPNSIPTMSVATGLAYCIGAHAGAWTLEGLDWNDGRSVLRFTLGKELGWNSIYAATEVGAGGSILSGTVGGLVRLAPAGASAPAS